MNRGPAWTFGAFRLDVGAGLLTRQDEPVGLPPRAFSVLCHLVTHAGALVTKEELLDSVWQHRFVSESALKGCINELRRALNDDAKAPRYIQTVARRGYRFIVEPQHFGAGAVVLKTPFRSVPWSAKQADVVLKRGAPLTHLQQRLASALSGKREIVFVTGEAGLGKTTLIESLCATLDEAAVAFLGGRCIEHYGAGEPYLPLIESLERACRTANGSDLIDRLSRWAPTWLAQMPGLLTGQAFDDLQRDIVGATNERMLREYVALLEAVSQELPLVLVVEDLHWSDAATLDAVSLLAQRHDLARLLVIGTYRPIDAAIAEHPVQHLVQQLVARERCSCVSLGPFSRAELSAYFAVRIPDAVVPEAIVDTVYRRTEGHPLFVTALIDDWVLNGLLPSTGAASSTAGNCEDVVLALPDRLRAMIEERIAKLDPFALQLLSSAAAAGEEWPTVLPAAALDIDPMAVEACCERLAHQGQMIAPAGVMEWPDGTVCGQFRFAHALYREVFYQRLTAVQSIRIHRRLGEHLIAAHGFQTQRVAAELADHFERGRDFPRALQYLVEAAANALRRYANREAIAYLNRAFTLLERLPTGQQEAARIDLLQRRADVHSIMDDLDSALADLKLVLHASYANNDSMLTVKTLVQISRLARWFDGRYSVTTAAEADAVSSTLSDSVMETWARLHHARTQLTFAMLHPEGWQRRNVWKCRKGHRALYAAQDQAMFFPTLGLPWVECMSSNYELARRLAEDGAQIAQACGDHFYCMALTWMRSWTTIYLGRLGESRQNASAALGVAEKNGNHSWIVNHRHVLARLHEEVLDFEGARAHGEHALEVGRGRRANLFTVHTHILLGRAYLGLEQTTPALAHLEEATRLCEAAQGIADWHMFLPLYQSWSEYWLSAGDIERAREMALALCNTAAMSPERTYLALGHVLLIEIALVENALDSAREALGRAFKVLAGHQTPRSVWAAYDLAPPEITGPCARVPLPLATWRVYVTAAKVHATLGQHLESASMLKRSRDAAQSLADSLDRSDPARASLATGLKRILVTAGLETN